jgi:hypothetical protein
MGVAVPRKKRPPAVLPVPEEDLSDDPAKKEEHGDIEQTEENYRNDIH